MSSFNNITDKLLVAYADKIAVIKKGVIDCDLDKKSQTVEFECVNSKEGKNVIQALQGMITGIHAIRPGVTPKEFDVRMETKEGAIKLASFIESVMDGEFDSDPRVGSFSGNPNIKLRLKKSIGATSGKLSFGDIFSGITTLIGGKQSNKQAEIAAQQAMAESQAQVQIAQANAQAAAQANKPNTGLYIGIGAGVLVLVVVLLLVLKKK